MTEKRVWFITDGDVHAVVATGRTKYRRYGARYIDGMVAPRREPRRSH